MNVALQTMRAEEFHRLRKTTKEVEIPLWLALEIHKKIEGTEIPEDPCIVVKIGDATVWSRTRACFFGMETTPVDAEEGAPRLSNAGLVHRRPPGKITL